MELSITNKKENKALGRTEITAAISFDKAMPSRHEVRDALCAAAGVQPDQLVIISVKGSFGTRAATVIAHTYPGKEGVRMEHKYLLIRDGLAQKEEKKKAEKKAPAKK